MGAMTAYDGPAILLRPVGDSDLDAIFDHMRDPKSTEMAAFISGDPDDRDYFDMRMAERLANPLITHRVITNGAGDVLGTVAAFHHEGQVEVSYWIDREWWGRGIAGHALSMLLEEVPERPLHARVASDNAASKRVLEKAGFRPVGTEVSFANARGEEIEETILRLD
jgi:RimJ/RimL family protein N-acetyltransferase